MFAIISAMELWNFNDTAFVILFVIVLVAIHLLIVVSVLFSVTAKRDKDFMTQLSYERTTTNIYIIDVKKNKMVSFNKSDIKDKVNSDLLSFYTGSTRECWNR